MSVAEAHALEAGGVVAQGYEAGGHRGVFDPIAEDDRVGRLALTRLLASPHDFSRARLHVVKDRFIAGEPHVAR